jgi:uncharacterized protein (TIGR02996 family)
MRTFEFTEGSSRKFWNIELDGKKTIVTFGRIGTKGQRKEKKFKTEAAAQKEYDKLIKEKLGKGYTETTSEAEEESTPAAPAAPALTGRAAKLKESLEAALLENPDDLATHAAYADLLSENGDPRGELIQVQLALEDEKRAPKERKDLQKREQQLLDAHLRTWFGDLAPKLLDAEVAAWQRKRGQYTHFRWRRGWIEALHLAQVSNELLQSVCDNPIFTLLRELTILERDWDNGDDDPDLTPLLRAPFASHLRAFQIGPVEDSCHISAPEVHKLAAKLPALEELRLCAHGVKTKKVFALPMPHLSVLVVHHIHEYPLEVLAKNSSLTRLESLSFWPHGLEPWHEGAYITQKGFKALVHSPHLTSLRHLAVYLSDIGDQGCEEIVESGILGRLKVLDVSRGCITDAGAGTLAACPELTNLERLVINKNMLTRSGIRALRATGVEVEAKEQYAPGEADEQEYLWEGDAE